MVVEQRVTPEIVKDLGEIIERCLEMGCTAPTIAYGFPEKRQPHPVYEFDIHIDLSKFPRALHEDRTTVYTDGQGLPIFNRNHGARITGMMVEVRLVLSILKRGMDTLPRAEVTDKLDNTRAG
jgi:hypothetical protein